jgi:hypothetical protein
MESRVLSHTPHDIHRMVTEKIVSALEAGTDTFTLPWHNAGAVVRPSNAFTATLTKASMLFALWRRYYTCRTKTPLIDSGTVELGRRDWRLNLMAACQSIAHRPKLHLMLEKFYAQSPPNRYWKIIFGPMLKWAKYVTRKSVALGGFQFGFQKKRLCMRVLLSKSFSQSVSSLKFQSANKTVVYSKRHRTRNLSIIHFGSHPLHNSQIEHKLS